MANIPKLTVHLSSDPDGRGYSAMTNSEAADNLNATRTEDGPFGCHSIVNYFIMTGNRPAAKEAAQILELHRGMQIDYSDSEHVALVTKAMDALVADGFATADDKTAVLSLHKDRVKYTDAQKHNLLGRSKEVGPAHVALARGE